MSAFAQASPLIAAAVLLVAVLPYRVSAQAACDSVTTQMDTHRCANERAKEADSRLTRLLIELQPHGDTAWRGELRRVQASWVGYRDAQCKWDRKMFEGGSLQPTEYLGCYQRLTEERIAILKSWLCEGGGDDCDAARKYDPPHNRPRH